MNKKKILEKLEELYDMKEVKVGFPSKQACIDWCNRVAPLLKFNKQYYLNFLQNSHKMNLSLSSHTLVPAHNIMVSQVKMAIEELKRKAVEGISDIVDQKKRRPNIHKLFTLFTKKR